MSQEKIQQLQYLEQNLQQFAMQKQQFQQQMIETDSALEELQDAKESYKILGGVMVSADKDKLINELSETKKELQLRIDTLEKQEGRLKEKATTLREEVMQGMKNDKD